ncbi:MAG: ABC transporter substrate-binding protein, partial [Spirochaetota bacterium]
MFYKKYYDIIKNIIILISIIICSSVLITAQNKNIDYYKPNYIENTLVNKRPLSYNYGNFGGTLKLGLTGRPKTFNEIQAKDSASINIINHLFIHLFEYNLDYNKWEVIPGIPDKGNTGNSYDRIIDKKNNTLELIIYLNNNIKWSDGTPMTADDWVWYYNNIIKNENLNHPAYNTSFIQVNEWEKKRIKYEKTDEYSFKIKFPKIIANAELWANSQAMPEHILKPLLDEEKYDEIKLLWNKNTNPENIVSNGPWLLESINENIISFKRNENYFINPPAINNNEKDNTIKNLPYINKLEYYIMLDTYNPLTNSNNTAKENEAFLFENAYIDALITDTSMNSAKIKELIHIENQNANSYNV